MRAVLAGSSTAGTNRSLVIAEQVLVSIGFFALLFGAYGLALARLNLCDEEPENPIARLTRNQRLFSLVATVAIVLSIVSSSSDDPDLANTLRKASVVIYLVLTVLQAYQSVILLKCENSEREYPRVSAMTTFGGRNGSFILMAIAVLLLIRQAFATATMSNLAKQYQEHLWYPLLALPEFLCVVLYALPGLIPMKTEAELPQYNLTERHSSHSG
ncbi:hypothetical protein PQX77_012559 [Marasmius sp. AFHP31]|nr:hypothetical protein PQX77_012559 [Marasmius sp. AFHP31]